jgi:uncharacterized protein
MKNLLVCLLITSTSFAGAQKPAATSQAPAKKSIQSGGQSERPSREQVLKLLDVLQIRDSLQLTLDAMKAQMKNGTVEMFREKVPSPTPEQLKSINAIVDEAFAEVATDDLIRDVAPIYQRHLTRGDVAALISFYSSPVGQKLRREQPAIMKESMEATSANQQQKMERLLAKVEVRVQQLVEADQKKPQ